jgi:hypothetical protein
VVNALSKFAIQGRAGPFLHLHNRGAEHDLSRQVLFAIMLENHHSFAVSISECNFGSATPNNARRNWLTYDPRRAQNNLPDRSINTFYHNEDFEVVSTHRRFSVADVDLWQQVFITDIRH